MHGLPSDPEANLEKIMKEIKENYNFLGIDKTKRFSNVKFTMITSKGGVKLKGKGNEICHIGKPLHLVWKKYRG